MSHNKLPTGVLQLLSVARTNEKHRGACAGAPLSTSAPRPALCSVRSSAFGLALDDRATPGVAVRPLHLASRPPTRVGGGEKCSPSRVRTSGLDRCDDSARSAQRARREVLTRRKESFHRQDSPFTFLPSRCCAQVDRHRASARSIGTLTCSHSSHTERFLGGIVANISSRVR